MASTKLLRPNGHSNHLNKSSSGDMNGHQMKTNKQNGDQDNQSNGTTNSSQSKSALALVEVRKRFLEYAEANPDKVNDRDKQKLATDDWYLKRYLLARNRRVNETLDMLRKTMEWRNEFGVHISEDAMFPLEFYKIGALVPYENDKKGNLVLFLRIKYHRKIDEMVEVEKHFLVHTFEKIDRITNGQGLVIVFDCQGAGYANCDVDFLQFLITCATEHAPVGLQYIIVYKLPWVMNAFWSIARKLLPAYLANRVRFCDENTVTDFIDKENLPDFMNGTCRRNYRWIPPGAPSVFKLANAHGITDAEIEKILPQFQVFLDEADEALNSSTYEDPPETVTNIGLRASETVNQEIQSADSSLGIKRHSECKESRAVIRLFPEEFLEFTYDAYNDIFHATVTIYNPSDKNSLAFKLMSNRPSNYSVKPARGVLAPNSSITLSIVLLNDHKPSDKFLMVSQPLEGTTESISRAQFDSLWSPNIQSNHSNTHTTIRLGSYLRKIVTTPAIQSSIKNPQVYELVTACRSLKRRQTLSIIVNIVLMIIIVNHLLFD